MLPNHGVNDFKRGEQENATEKKRPKPQPIRKIINPIAPIQVSRKVWQEISSKGFEQPGLYGLAGHSSVGTLLGWLYLLLVKHW